MHSHRIERLQRIRYARVGRRTVGTFKVIEKRRESFVDVFPATFVSWRNLFDVAPKLAEVATRADE
jgi:hypothetical protein